ncbi:MAG: tetratricopeptide repeat protein, partial [Candidatus Dependentiae bacterium]
VGAGAGSASGSSPAPTPALPFGLGTFDGRSTVMHRDISSYYAGYSNQEVIKGAQALARKAYDDAFSYFDSAADHSDAAGRALLGVCYFKGYVVKQNRRKAVNLLRSAASGKDPFGMYFLAVCYLTGKGCGVDESRGMEWMQSAADAGHEDAKDIVKKYEGGVFDRIGNWKRFLTKRKVGTIAFKMLGVLKPL